MMARLVSLDIGLTLGPHDLFACGLHAMAMARERLCTVCCRWSHGSAEACIMHAALSLVLGEAAR